MKFEYEYQVKTSDLWQASMYYTYSSYLAVINIVCIISAIALMVSMWNKSEVWVRVGLVMFVLLFVLVQPFVVWARARSQLAGNHPMIRLTFTDGGINIEADGKKQDKTWKNVRGIVKKPTIVVIYMEDGNGYILNNKTLGTTKKDFYEFAMKMTEKK